MNPIAIFSVCLVLSTLSVCSGRPAEEEPVGKYRVSKSNKNDDGSYRPVKRNEGRYIHMVQPYVHIHDNRELGKYRHIPNPYDGGYGPYSGLQNPYEHDESGNYDKYTTSSTTTRRPTTTTTTTVRPRLFNYYEEGGWRILRQEEEKEKHKYDFLYHTENGIYGEEKAHLHPNAGTAASGYYEYTGDDGELYRVNYKSDHNGFVPEADHIPTPPPVPEAIKRALEYTARRKETHGLHNGQYEHRVDPVRLQNMPTIDRPIQPVQQQQRIALPTLPALPSLPPLPSLQPRFLQYSGDNQYTPLPTLRPGLRPQRPADQLIQQTQLAQQEQPDQLPQVQVQLPQQVAEGQALTERPQIEQKQEEQMQSDQPEEEQMQGDQPQEDQHQEDEPQVDPQQEDQPQDEQQSPQEEPLEENPAQDQELEPDQSIALAVSILPDRDLLEKLSKAQEQSPEASEQENAFQPPYQSPDTMIDEANFELAMA